MAQQIGEDTKITLDLKTIGMAAAGVGTIVAMWFALQADIAEAKELPAPLAPEITRMEFDMKDQLVRQTIMTTQEDVTEIKEDIKRIEEKIDQLRWQMKILPILFAFSALSLAATSVADVADDKICDSGICVVEFNASFNSQNKVEWIESLNDCETSRVDIATAPALQQEHKIVVVPTIVVFNEGEEVKRFQANIMMTMEASMDDVQEAIDEILMSDF